MDVTGKPQRVRVVEAERLDTVSELVDAEQDLKRAAVLEALRKAAGTAEQVSDRELAIHRAADLRFCLRHRVETIVSWC